MVNASYFVVHADERLTAFLELQKAIHEFAVNLVSSVPEAQPKRFSYKDGEKTKDAELH